MGTDDLKQLEALLGMADAVVPVREGNTDPRVITMRHDVDDRGWDSCCAMAMWEAERGYRSTYYFLHTAPYWNAAMSPRLHRIADMGHEIGLHHNCLAEWYTDRVDPFLRLTLARDELHRWSGRPITGLCAHGDDRCYAGGFSNYQMFAELSDEKIVRGRTWKLPSGAPAPRPAADFGFKYHAELQPRKLYLSDSGGEWHESLGIVDAAAKFALGLGPLTILQHPDWWPLELFV